jgi:hypothetical protein
MYAFYVQSEFHPYRSINFPASAKYPYAYNYLLGTKVQSGFLNENDEHIEFVCAGPATVHFYRNMFQCSYLNDYSRIRMKLPSSQSVITDVSKPLITRKAFIERNLTEQFFGITNQYSSCLDRSMFCCVWNIEVELGHGCTHSNLREIEVTFQFGLSHGKMNFDPDYVTKRTLTYSWLIDSSVRFHKWKLPNFLQSGRPLTRIYLDGILLSFRLLIYGEYEPQSCTIRVYLEQEIAVDRLGQLPLDDIQPYHACFSDYPSYHDRALDYKSGAYQPGCVSDRCYITPQNIFILEQTNVTWDEAEERCAAVGGHLLSVNSELEFSYVWRFARGGSESSPKYSIESAALLMIGLRHDKEVCIMIAEVSQFESSTFTGLGLD